MHHLFPSLFIKKILSTGFVLLVFFAPAACRALETGTEQQNLGSSSYSAMTLGQAAVLGIVEGLTEYLPVSSTGHLLLAERAMNIGGGEQHKEASDAYAICIQLGAILAVFGLYFNRIKQMVNGLRGSDDYGRRLFVNVVVGFVPAAVIGLLFNKVIKLYLFGVWPVVTAWFVGGVAIVVVSWRGSKKPHRAQGGLTIMELSWRMALIIGFAQCIAMWPGVSRSLVTIVGGVLVGLSLSAAVEFSFLLGLVTLSAATAYDALKHGEVMLRTFDGLSLAVGVVFAFIAALISVKWMVAYLNRHGLAVFGYYRIVLSLAVALLLINGMV